MSNNIKPLIETGETPHLTIAIVQTFSDREPEVILPLMTGEKITVQLMEMEISRLQASIKHCQERILYCEILKAPACITDMRRAMIAERLAEIEALKGYIEVCRKSWAEPIASLDAESPEDEEEAEAREVPA